MKEGRGRRKIMRIVYIGFMAPHTPDSMIKVGRILKLGKLNYERKLDSNLKCDNELLMNVRILVESELCVQQTAISSPPAQIDMRQENMHLL